MPDWVTLSKLLVQLIYPANIVLWLLVFAFVLILLRRAKAAGVALVLALVLVGIGSSPITPALYHAHERQYLPVPVEESPVAEAIVILAGDLSIPAPPRVESQLRGNRVIHALRLYRAGKAPRVIVSGGNIFPQEGLEPESAYIAALLQELGIPAAAITAEGSSRNTHENAVETARLLEAERVGSVLLVTNAFHMPRAVAVFRSAGVQVIPSPSSISAELTQPKILDWMPSLDGLGTLKSVLHEKIGILVYRVRGWID
ncbi:MAG: YdcF family protein [Arenicellales bacterium]|jgi:uncharacterized SAM-binding protein YcdF (DUF218 family)|nr:YdcF family protein [Arenicellales bacterium]|tara:strand:+ start:290 stop:1063 length:774 start_codon:yes stop_codon:yes gene_type:complete